jgi:hypothetical protein
MPSHSPVSAYLNTRSTAFYMVISEKAALVKKQLDEVEKIVLNEFLYHKVVRSASEM